MLYLDLKRLENEIIFFTYFYLYFFLCKNNKCNSINSITKYEIQKLMQDRRISKQEAINELINEKLELAEIEKYRIFANEYEIEDEMNKMLSQSGSSISAMKVRLNPSDFQKAKNKFKTQLEKRKLYEALLGGFKVDTSDQGAKNYYENHRDEFMLFTKISDDVLTSSNDRELETYRRGGIRSKSIKSQRVVLSPENSDIRLLAFLSRIKENESTSIMQNGDIFVSYRVIAKSNAEYFQFEQIKNEVKNVYANRQRDEYLSDYFDKLRVKAEIKYLR